MCALTDCCQIRLSRKDWRCALTEVGSFILVGPVRLAGKLLGGVHVSTCTCHSSSSCIIIMTCCHGWVVLTNTPGTRNFGKES